ncbi:hypothetical protein FPV67DRAFT_872407 [Lyophyllum atratum]|nr:hypothetical protein FPV67DRAFT_872407 [Lyophyllum atratum]
MNSRQLRDPPMTAILGRVCYTCFKSKTKMATLSKCGRCQRVRYCGADCQKADWKNGHKDLCNAFRAVENDRFIKAAVSGVLSDEPFSDLSRLNAIIETLVKNQARYMVLALERSLTISEQNLIGWEPRCMGCGRTDRDIRTEAATTGSGSTPPTLKACQACKLAFYCCTRHWDAVQHKHAGEPCEDGHDGLTQCQMNQELRLDEGFATTQTEAQALSRWAPARVLPRWMPLGATNWEAEYSSWLTLEFRLLGKAVAPFLQAASDALSMPMTILNALEILNPDDAWTRKETLTIHILGAYDPEFQKANVFEEILHRLPEVKKLKVVLCGPELENIIDPSVWNIDIDMSTCRYAIPPIIFFSFFSGLLIHNFVLQELYPPGTQANPPAVH